MTTNTTCTICCDGFNASTRKPISCPFHSCAKTACRACYQTFLCGEDVTVPKCIFCNTQFTHSQLQQLGLTKSFLLGEFARHQQDILFAQEQAMLPAAQAAVAHDRLVQNIDDQIKSVTAEIKRLLAFKHDLMHTKNQLRRNGPQQHELPNNHNDNDNHNHNHNEFIHRCAHSDCNGFVSSAWKCATCDKYTCPHCREIKADRDDPLHLCNPDSVSSVALLKTDTKPCPNCKVLVHKTDGCDQMFCTQCKRLWSWNTGRFETRGHNPHYLQWMRQNLPNGMPRDPNDVLCGREIDPHFLSQLQLARRRILDTPLRNEIDPVLSIIFSVPHLRFHELPRYLVDRIAINLTHRKAFVSNKLSLHKFKLNILRNHLLANKHEHIAQIIQAVIQAITDIAFRFLHILNNFILYTHSPLQHTPLQHEQHQLHDHDHHHDHTLSHTRNILLELHNLLAYANHELNIIHNDFHSTKSKRLLISHNLRFILY